MTEPTEDMDRLLAQSEALDDDVAKLLRRCRPISRRAAISLALANAAFEHAVSQRVLLEAGLSGTAMALCRLQFEAVVRAAWTGQGASERGLDAFSTPVEGEGHKEPVMGPPIPAMPDAFAEHVPHVAAEFRKLYGTIRAMHSFVHSGSQAVGHALMGGYPAEKLASVLHNRNLLQWFTANCLWSSRRIPRWCRECACCRKSTAPACQRRPTLAGRLEDSTNAVQSTYAAPTVPTKRASRSDGACS